MLDNKHLRSFLQVLDLASFSNAARALNTAQPAVSQHVRKLEEMLGTRLLNRLPSGVTATPAGLAFARDARDILERVEQSVQRFRGNADTIYGRVRLGLPGSVCPVLGPAVILACADELPNVELVVSERMSGDLAEHLATGKTDVAILFNVKETEDFSSQPLAREELHYVTSPGDTGLVAETIEANEVAQKPLVLTRQPHGLRRLIDHWSAEAGLTLDVRVEADAPSLMVGLIEAGSHASILSEAAIVRDRSLGRVRSAAIVSPPIVRTACLCASKRIPSDAARDAVCALVNAVALKAIASGKWPAHRLA